MLERVLDLPGQARRRAHGDEPPTLELAHGLADLRCSDRDRHGLVPEHATDDRRFTEDAPLDLGQCIDSGGEQSVDRVGDRHVRGNAGGPPATLLPCQRPGLDEPADDLLDEERIALGRLEDLVLDRRRQIVGREQAVEEARALGLVERPQRHGRRLSAAQREGRVRFGEFRARRRQEEDRSGRADKQPLHHVDDLIGAPMEVLDDHHEWLAGGEPGQELRPAPRELGDHRHRAAAVERVVGQRDAGRRRQGEGDSCDVVHRQLGREDLAHAAPEFLLAHRPAVVERDAAGGPDDLRERPVGDALADGRAAPAQDCEIGMSRSTQRDDLADQPALADAGRTVDDCEPRCRCLDRLLEKASEDGHLSISANHARLEVARGAGLDRALDPAEERMGGHRSFLALEAELDRLAKAEERSCRLERPVADEHGPQRRLRLQAGGDVDRVARDHGPVGMDLGRGEDLAGVDADPEGELDAVPVLQIRGEIGEPLGDLGCGTEGPGGVVFPDPGDPEDRDDGIADVFLDRAAPGLDGRRNHGEVVLEDRADPFGIETLAEGGGVREVDENGRGQLPLLWRGLTGDRLPARGAEPGTVRDRGPTTAALGRELGPARCAEPGTVGVLGRARRALHDHLLSVRRRLPSGNCQLYGSPTWAPECSSVSRRLAVLGLWEELTHRRSKGRGLAGSSGPGIRS